MDVKNIPIEKLRKGDFFTIKPRENPKPNQVYVFEGYDRYLKAYTATKFDNISVGKSFKKGTQVFTDFIF